jgi:hypothetical protein
MNISFTTNQITLQSKCNTNKISVKIIDKNKIILNDDYLVNVYPILQQDNTFLFTTPKIKGTFGSYKNYELNYVIYNFYVSFLPNNNNFILHSNSEAKYGNQLNNMSTELLTNYLIQN